MTTLLRIAVAAALFIGLLYFDLIDFAVLLRLTDSPLSLLLALALIVLTTPISSLRWHVLLRCQGFKPTLGKVVQVTFIGQFFNIFLPGSCGGDVVRLGYLYRAAGTALSRLLFSLILDRLLGLLGLITLGLAATAVFGGSSAPVLTAYLVGFVLAVVIGTMAALRYGDVLVDLLRRIPHRLGKKLFSFARETIGGLRLYRENPWSLVSAWMLSVLQSICVIASIQVIGEAINIGTLSWLENAIAGTLSLILNALPLTPGGLGLGEASYSHFANRLGDKASIAPYATVFFAFRALNALAYLPGAALFLLYRHDVMEYIHTTPEARPR